MPHPVRVRTEGLAQRKRMSVNIFRVIGVRSTQTKWWKVTADCI